MIQRFRSSRISSSVTSWKRMARFRQASMSSGWLSESTPSHRYSRSSRRRFVTWWRSCTSRCPGHQVAACGKPSILDMADSCWGDMFLRLIFSLKRRANLRISLSVGYSTPSMSFSWNTCSSAALSANFSSVDSEISLVRCKTTCCQNSAISSFALNLRAIVALSYFCSKKVDGSMFGKSLSAKGRRISAKGTMMKSEKGINLRKSDVVLTSRRRSRTVMG
mmetsp:Transcript_25533/g.64937  ORF Transcript_25533/g.64937 Transcript_25533/m.64937 type:complete len:221 (+) Transcript_25533:974-1636(+)